MYGSKGMQHNGRPWNFRVPDFETIPVYSVHFCSIFIISECFGLIAAHVLTGHELNMLFFFNRFHIWLCFHTHRIHGAGIYANIGGILMVNVTIYSIHGSYGICFQRMTK